MVGDGPELVEDPLLPAATTPLASAPVAMEVSALVDAATVVAAVVRVVAVATLDVANVAEAAVVVVTVAVALATEVEPTKEDGTTLATPVLTAAAAFTAAEDPATVVEPVATVSAAAETLVVVEIGVRALKLLTPLLAAVADPAVGAAVAKDSGVVRRTLWLALVPVPSAPLAVGVLVVEMPVTVLEGKEP